MPKRDPNRIPRILDKISQVWTKNPDLRLSQLVVAMIGPHDSCPEVFYFEDTQLEEKLDRFLTN